MCVGFNITQHMTGHLGDAIDCTGSHNQKQGYTLNTKEKQKTALANKTIYTLIWLRFLRSPAMKWSGPYS